MVNAKLNPWLKANLRYEILAVEILDHPPTDPPTLQIKITAQKFPA